MIKNSEMRRMNRRMSELAKQGYDTDEFLIAQDRIKKMPHAYQDKNGVWKMSETDRKKGKGGYIANLINNSKTAYRIKRTLKKLGMSFDEYKEKNNVLTDLRSVPSPTILKTVKAFYADPDHPEWSWENITLWAKKNKVIKQTRDGLVIDRHISDRDWAKIYKKIGTMKSTGEW